MDTPYSNYHADFIPSLSNIDEINDKLLSFEQGIIDIRADIQQKRLIIDTRTAIRGAFLREIRNSPQNGFLKANLTPHLDAVIEEIAADWREYNYSVAQLVRYLRVRELLWEQRDLALQNSTP
ncbi:hypothetical protein Q9L58_004502 [Maublancomyces gigas]|uniref:Uncharacterized protein n=1 Tax=Discina gigas TaxID=1032678 RepID=A0ABR3GL05_9PEZI